MNSGGAIVSRDRRGSKVVRGLERSLRVFSGASSVRVIEAGNSQVPEHCHDWPVLSLYVMGDWTKVAEDGVTRINGPSAVLHPAFEAHANAIGAMGMEQIDIQFDPAWIAPFAERILKLDRLQSWRGGSLGLKASALAALWTDADVPEEALAARTATFLASALSARPSNPPRWLSQAQAAIRHSSGSVTTQYLAEQLGLHPSWLAQAYRDASGEGIRDTARRLRVELAARMLRETTEPAAEIAAAVGFCDQSHMIRCFTAVLGRSPASVREEGRVLRARVV